MALLKHFLTIPLQLLRLELASFNGYWANYTLSELRYCQGLKKLHMKKNPHYRFDSDVKDEFDKNQVILRPKT